MIIRPVEPGDRDAWVRMRGALWPDDPEEHPVEVDRFFDGSAREPQAVFVAEAVDGALAGFAELSVRPFAEGCVTDRVGFLEGWYVEPAYRRSGVGRRLVQEGERWARARGCTEFASDTEWDNQVSAAAHEACGFEEVGLVRCFRKAL
jgi:aminoglycoside 6'-N-acetyltransferase I